MAALSTEAIQHGLARMQGWAYQGKGLQKKYPFIHDVRGIGLMDAIEIDSRERRDRITHKAFERGLLLLGSGYKVIRFLPPLDIRSREIEIALEILEAACKEAQ